MQTSFDIHLTIRCVAQGGRENMAWFDVLMLVLLVAVMPIRAMLNSFGQRKIAVRAENRLTRYRRSIAIALALTGALAFIWARNSRPIKDLGFDVPLSSSGIIGLILAVVILGALAATSAMSAKRENLEKLELASRTMPRTRKERAWFVILGLVLGFAWELLYRGYLLWLLTPQLGTGVAVSIAAISYGLAHGYENGKQIISSIAAAFAFTVAFALTQSIWWLILIHSTLPIIGLLTMAKVTGQKSPAA